ncbi:MAG TPA: cell division protein FtsH, partial [Caulobacteraceae bacterium]|nr:cell division protein FtsH [Caulobacteraceae bacterium]
ARRILTERLEELHTLAKALLEYETLSGEEIVNVMKGVPPVREKPEDKKPSGPSVAVPLTHGGPEPELA